ncbi:hypothetical protein [Cardinium endosymbiont of Culicoides punctatus]|uniref:hypothetical protein n=1 Tax=Cardinium endosymbiont of Culicoides punctatus TaxID=2304601 RepID=UPI0010589065|nr:hypothetical protein [Cardinium endosymbiont of Culicoides punctatus]TDG95371.1 hypothetical protein CCPUN_04650 [Cardinium endosymbiont of Culicoides punctatus]
MKFLSNILILAAFLTSGCHHASKELRAIDEQSVVPYDGPPQEGRNSEKIPKPITQAATKQLIHNTAPGEVLCVWVTPDGFKDLGLDFNQFVTVLQEGHQEQICFIMQEALRELAPIIHQYVQMHPTTVRAIEVADPYDFAELTSKTNVGAGGGIKTGYTKNHIGGYTAFRNTIRVSSNWETLDISKIEAAFSQIPAQVEGWSCGPNSGARALILAGQPLNSETLAPWNDPSGFAFFLQNCPKATEIAGERADVTRGIGIGGLIGGILLTTICPPVGIPLLVGGGITAGAGVATRAITDHNTTGPTPYYLSEYIDRHLSDGYKDTKVCSYDHFKDCAAVMEQDMVEYKDPVIVFFLYEPTLWHYANVIGCERDGQSVSKFMILNTDQNFYWLSYENMKYLMRNDYRFNTFFACKGDIRKYTIIRFYKK